MKKLRTVLVAWIAAVASIGVCAEEATTANPLVAPIATYHSLLAEEQTVHAPGGGVLVLSGDDLFVGTYTYTRYEEAPKRYDGDAFHTIDMLYDGSIGRHTWVGLFKSAADRPVIEGWETFQSAVVWGYDVLDRPRTSLVVGGGAAVSDFGIETSSGATWPLIPVPFIRFGYESRWIEYSFDFITGPNMHLAIAPQRDLHGTVDLRIDQFRDLRDLVYDVSVAYRFFSLGVKNDTYGFAVDTVDEPYETFYSGAYASVDVTILTVTGGYAFDTRARYSDGEIDRTGEGFFLSAQVVLPLGGSSAEGDT